MMFEHTCKLWNILIFSQYEISNKIQKICIYYLFHKPNLSKKE